MREEQINATRGFTWIRPCRIQSQGAGESAAGLTKEEPGPERPRLHADGKPASELVPQCVQEERASTSTWPAALVVAHHARGEHRSQHAKVASRKSVRKRVGHRLG